MSVKSVEKKDNSTVELVLEVSSDKFESALNSAYTKRKNSFMLPGFRKGKAPRKMIERMYGDSIFYEDAINILFPDVYSEAIESESLNTVGRPALDDVDVSDDKVLTLKVTAAIYPEVELGQYKGLSAGMPSVEVTDADIDSEIETIRNRNARLVPVERAAANGDMALFDFEGFVEGKAFEGGKAENHNLILGSGRFIPGFEDQIIGMMPGEEKDIEVTFPEDYAIELAGKEAVFKIKLHEIKENILPELDDEFAKDVSECDTLEEYRKTVSEKLLEERTKTAKETFNEALIDKAIENMKADVPEAMVDEALDNMMQEYEYRLSAQGMSLEGYLKMMGMDVEGFKSVSRPNAVKRVNTELLLKKIAEDEKIELSDEEIEVEYARLAEMYEISLERVKEMFTPVFLSNNAKLDKAKEIIIGTGIEEKATAKKTAAKKASKKAEAAAEESGEAPKPTKKNTSKNSAKSDPAKDDSAE